ncbi:hypothetical protein AtNW77_Chr1g0039561 [Arabidopsis thaliana]|uniref:Uncharacterized protein F12A4.5 n=3 Tax=Arabidopsis TaxID=3701 RepID=Q9C8P4_ARATH|nr:hypothetical protein (DUF1184) [Arabidopsis thaliana]AAG52117.1 hypothetical protein; 44638-43858 [Arabidopsis thaliana]AEE31789.1 hypothetical protein (DUF1184) [Arabidopsis thaliana]KAG7648526.1 hypothetical protein ISN45_At01g034930 [Arabidopsis thaliana x Arabidopsis arenosa]OAP16228.1 hypothetical protein AXX17_AT1G36180 [Arabidopsis thaliana]|eukprot:NP_174772.1 hypothetical protein (DUF1184) [Arabidopsis thaliana]
MYTTRSCQKTDLNKEKENQKEEAIRPGVKLSLFVAEAMFLLSDNLPFNIGVGGLNSIVLILKNNNVVKSYSFEYYNQELKKLEEKLRSAKEFSEANGFVREEIKSNILHLWKSLFEATPEVRNSNKTIVLELFSPIDNEVCCRLASLLI